MQLGVLVATARASSPDDAALITLLGLLGLRVSEACAVNIEDLGTERGHRTLHVIGKGNKPALIPLPVPVARTLDQAAGERPFGPLIRTRAGARMDRNAASRIVHRLAKRAGIEHRVGCHALRHAYITAALDAGVPLRDVQIAARHATLHRPPATTAPEATSTVTPTTSSPPSSPVPPSPIAAPTRARTGKSRACPTTFRPSATTRTRSQQAHSWRQMHAARYATWCAVTPTSDPPTPSTR